MNKIVNVGLIFKNRVGIVSQVSKRIFENDGNIINSEMIKLGNHFAFDLNATFRNEYDNKIFDNIENLYKHKHLKDEYLKDVYKTGIRLYSSDNPGIIHSTSEKLESLNADITRLSSFVSPAPFSSGPLFSLNVEFNINRSYPKDYILEQMQDVVNNYNCDIDIN